MATMPGLRPLAVGEILDAGIKLFMRNWRVLATCVVGFVLPLQILSVIVLLSLAPDQLDPSTAEATPFATADDTGLLVAEIAIAALQGLGYLLVVGSCFKAIADDRLGAVPDARSSLAFLRPRLGAVLGVFVLYVAGVTLGAFALFVPGVWLAVAWSLAIPALLLERLGPAGALRRSFRLVQGRWWGIFGAAIVGVLLASLVGAFIESLLVAPVLVGEGSDVAAAIASVVGGTVGGVITAPFTAAVVVLLYLDQRVRKESFDAGSLAQALGDQQTAVEPVEPMPITPPVDEETRWLPPQPPSGGS